MIATPLELEYFAELYRVGHVTRAAARLGISQPALTQSLNKLEKRVNSRLFYRSRQGLRPTRQGEIFFQSVQGLLEHWRQLQNRIRETQVVVEGSFRVGCHASVGSYVLPSFFTRLRERGPRIEISLSHDLSRNITDQIVQRELDLAFVVNPVKHPDLVLVRWGTDEVAYWKKKGDQKNPPVLFLNSELLQTREILRKTRGPVVSYRRVESGSLELIRTLVRAGEGVGILPTRVARAEGEGLELLDVKLPRFHDEIFLAYRRELVTSQAGKILLDCARNP